jgi:hypothetical protein
MCTRLWTHLQPSAFRIKPKSGRPTMPLHFQNASERPFKIHLHRFGGTHSHRRLRIWVSMLRPCSLTVYPVKHCLASQRAVVPLAIRGTGGRAGTNLELRRWDLRLRGCRLAHQMDMRPPLRNFNRTSKITTLPASDAGFQHHALRAGELAR